MIQKYC